jgi:hypothetical protein
MAVDEIGYLPVSQTGAILFFQLMSRRYEHACTVLTSNKGFEEWGEVLGDKVMAAALIDMPSIIISTRFFPMSWRPSFTVPITTLPRACTPADTSYGFKTAAPTFIALEATSTSGTKMSLFLNFSPMISIAGMSPFSSMSLADEPSAIAFSTSSLTARAAPD